MIAIPAIDIMDGSCVRLVKGLFNQKKTYSKNPLDIAKAFEDKGITHLHLVDLDGARMGKPVHLKLLETVAEETSLNIDYGGGIRSLQSIGDVLSAGAKKVNLGTFLFSRPDVPGRCIERFGNEALIAAVDIKEGKVAVKGWQELAGPDARGGVEYLLDAGWRYISVTDISRDGTMLGPDPAFYKPLVEHYPGVRVIGGGGVASMTDLRMLQSFGLYAAVTGKAILEGKISPEDLSLFNKSPPG